MLSQNALDLLKKRYAHKEKSEKPEDVCKRVAKVLAIRDKKFEAELLDAMLNGIFLPNSPTIVNAGKKNAMLSACFVLPIEDSIESIFDTTKNMAKIFQRGGGVGINFSPLRPSDAALSTGGTSSGTLSFMGLFNEVTEVVKQGGFRRGAAMGGLYFNHPEITNFCRAKLDGISFKNFNLSVVATDEFMEKATKGGKIELVHGGNNYNSIPAKGILDLIAFCAWQSGDPGMLFYDRMNKDNKLFPEVKIEITNPCLTGDTLIAVADGRNAVSIAELARIGLDAPVYCKDENKKTSIRWMRNIIKTGHKEIFKVSLDDGTFVKCTKDHKFLLSDNSYKEAGQLCSGDSLMRIDTYLSNGYRQISSLNRSRRQYRMIYEFFNGPVDSKKDRIHHDDFKKLNDCISNLVKHTIEEHKEIHDISGDRNPIFKLKQSGKFEEYKKRNPFYDVSGEDNPMYGKIPSQYQRQRSREVNSGRAAWNKGLTKETDKRVATYSAKLEIRKPGFRNSGTWEKGHTPWNKGVYNHKVVSVEFCGHEDVYDGTVDEFHNFAVLTKTNDKFIETSGVFVHNCGEVPLPPYGACTLGSINIAKMVEGDKFNFDMFHNYCGLATRALLNCNMINWYPGNNIAKVMRELNPIGVGIMGFADACIMLGINYDSKECLDFIDQLGKPYVEATNEVAPDSFYRRSIAPTGSLSIIANCSSGIEPVFDSIFDRNLTVGVVEETRDIYSSKFLRIAHDISPEWHLKVQAQWQKYVDAGVSKTINVSTDIDVEEIKSIYIKAWKLGVKGITIFRDKCKEGVYVSRSKCEGESCTL